MQFSIQDLAATLVSVILAVAVAIIVVQGHEVPVSLASPLSTAMTWLFFRATQTSNSGGNHNP